jgi:membrane-bound serine protease (ClpP class)
MTADTLSGLVTAMLVAVATGPTAAQEPAAPEPASGTPVIYTAEVEAIIHPVSAEFMVQTMDAADEAGAGLVVFTLRTPGGLVDSTRTIVTRMLASETPVAVFVGPAGARAASAGFIITIAADIAAMAPGTHIGAAHPVQAGGGGEAPDETMAQKAAEDVAAWVRTLASGRERNVALAEEAVMDSRAFTEEEALNASPPLIDLLATDLPDLIRQLDGLEVRRFDGSTVTLATAGAAVESIAMSQRQRVLSAIAHPEIAFILLSLGVLGLTIELWNPGAILPGIVGGVSLLLAFFALQVLPVNYVGLLLMLLGLGLFALEIKVTSYGLLTVGGVISLVLGSMMLIDSPVPEMRLSLGFVLPIVLGFVAIAGFLVQLALRAQRQRDASGSNAMIGLAAEALSALEPGRAGQVRVQGEIWRATAAEAIPEGAPVRVTAVDGLTLTVSRKV